MFGFTFVTIIPDYYSLQALMHDMEAPEQGNTEEEYPIDLRFVYGDGYLAPGTGRQYIQTDDHVQTSKMLKQINAHFDRIKPTGSIFPPVIFDWYVEHYTEADMDITEFHKLVADACYEEAYNEATHGNALPVSARNLNLNNLLFPTSKDPDFLSTVRIRMTIAPNTRVAFSNESMLEHFGFDESQIPARSPLKQINFINQFPTQFVQFVSQKGQAYETTKGKNSKITVYPFSRLQEGKRSYIQTTRMREINPVEFVDDVKKAIEKIGRECNQTISVSFKGDENQFHMDYPVHAAIKVEINVPPKVAKLLGFQTTNQIVSPQQPSQLTLPSDIETSEKKARTWAFDVGMIFINLEQHFSSHNHQFTNVTMAILEADYPGTMSTRGNQNMPSVQVTYYSPDMEFVAYRFSEKGYPMHLGLQISVYVQGVLEGKPINTKHPMHHH